MVIGRDNAARSMNSSHRVRGRSSSFVSTASGVSVSRLGDRDRVRASMRILHVITDLNLGGAEMMLYRLLQLGIESEALEMSRFPNPFKLFRLAKIIRDFRPAVVQAWMYHANLIGGLAAWLAGDVPIICAIHSCVLEPQRARRTTRWTVALCAWLSRWIPHRIVAVSRASRDQHVAIGYDAGKFVVIPNGFDLEQYRPDSGSRRDVRSELRVDSNTVLIGLVARMDPVK